MRRSLSLLTATIAISACSATSISTWSAPLPPDADPAVAAVMPKGTYTVSGGLSIGGHLVYELNGFVDFGTAPDGTECEADYTVTDLKYSSDYTKVERTRSWHGVRVVGDPEWYADTSALGTDASRSNLEWKDANDASSAHRSFLFTPSIVASELSSGVFEGAGNGELCSIGVIPRFMRLDGEQLMFDAARVTATMAAKDGHYISQQLAAVGVRGGRYDELAEKLTELYGIGYDALLADRYLTLSDHSDGGFEIVQVWKGVPDVTLIFTPADDRVVTAPDSATYFERLAEKAKRGDKEAMLRQTIKERAGLVSLGDEESSDDAAEPAWLTDLLR
jgi:hypothetical protein